MFLAHGRVVVLIVSEFVVSLTAPVSICYETCDLGFGSPLNGGHGSVQPAQRRSKAKGSVSFAIISIFLWCVYRSHCSSRSTLASRASKSGLRQSGKFTRRRSRGSVCLTCVRTATNSSRAELSNKKSSESSSTCCFRDSTAPRQLASREGIGSIGEVSSLAMAYALIVSALSSTWSVSHLPG